MRCRADDLPPRCRSCVIIEVAANAVKNAHSPLWSLNSRPTHRHPALDPAVITDPNQSATCPVPPLISLCECGGVRRGAGVKAGEREGTECAPAPKVSDYYTTAVGSVQNRLYQLFKTHNSVPIKDLLQQTEKQSTGTTETENTAAAIRAAQGTNCSCQ